MMRTLSERNRSEVERNPKLWRRLGVIAKRPDGRNGALTEALEADALLLREENARLRVKLEAAPDAGAVIERLRALPKPATQPSGGDHTTSGNNADSGDDTWQMLTEVLVMRNSLIDLCRQIGEVMAGLESSLEALSAPQGYLGGELAGNGNLRNGHRSHGHLKEASQS
jgi:hypothetical protein